MVIAQPIDCLSLCGLVLHGECSAESAERTVGQLFELRSAAVPYELPARIYVGSSFCPQLVLALNARHVSALGEFASWEGIPITLVLPIATQRWLDPLLSHVDELLDAADGAIDEVTVNDYGAFMYWGERIAEEELALGLNLGRLLNKDTRDPRDELYASTPHAPRLLEQNIYGYGNIERLLQTFPVAGIELDPTHAALELGALPEELSAAVYGPQCYMSTGQICEFASIGLDDTQKFRPNETCSLQCQRAAICYNGASGVEFSKIGRAIYYDAPAPVVRGVAEYRNVFSPLKEVLG